MVHRRRILKTAAALSVWSLTSGHTPYRQWAVYRRKHLMIGANKADPPTYELGKKIAALLAEELPESRARVARAPHAWRLASLLTSDQIQLVLLGEPDLRGLRDGRDGFEAFGPTDLRALYRFGGYWLISRPDFRSEHVALITSTLAEHGAGLAKQQGLPSETEPVPAHPAALVAHEISAEGVRKN
ncbi:MAG: hypothetical protein OEU92_08215 [Alphaproteobacteria bacterium]|nr:hypothetical protein [Alphaproteobacteria bacterium]